MSQVKPIPDGYHSVTPYLICDGAAAAIDFYVRAFGATELMRLPGPGGKLGHAEIRIGNSPVMLADEHREHGALGPKTIGGSPVLLVIYVEDVDAAVAQAVAAGGTLTREVADQFYGDRTGAVTDPFGHTWHIHTHIRDVGQAELEQGAQALADGAEKG